jgi:ribonuclease HI
MKKKNKVVEGVFVEVSRVINPVSGDVVEIEFWLDPSSGAIFGVSDAAFGGDAIVSPYNKSVTVQCDRSKVVRNPCKGLAIIHFDGVCRPTNPGYGFFGYTIECSNMAKITGSGYSGRGTNNAAEYSGIIAAMQRALSLGIKNVEIRADSQLVVNQLLGEWEVRAEVLLPMYRKASNLLKAFHSAELVWVPRDQNREADWLATEAYNHMTQQRGEQMIARAVELVEQGVVVPLGLSLFKVSQYTVDLSAPNCNCGFFNEAKKGICKHIEAVRIYKGKELESVAA